MPVRPFPGPRVTVLEEILTRIEVLENRVRELEEALHCLLTARKEDADAMARRAGSRATSPHTHTPTPGRRWTVRPSPTSREEP